MRSTSAAGASGAANDTAAFDYSKTAFCRYAILGTTRCGYSAEHDDYPEDVTEYARKLKEFFTGNPTLTHGFLPLLADIVKTFGSFDELPYRHCITALLALLDTEKDAVFEHVVGNAENFLAYIAILSDLRRAPDGKARSLPGRVKSKVVPDFYAPTPSSDKLMDLLVSPKRIGDMLKICSYKHWSHKDVMKLARLGKKDTETAPSLTCDASEAAERWCIRRAIINALQAYTFGGIDRFRSSLVEEFAPLKNFVKFVEDVDTLKHSDDPSVVLSIVDANRAIELAHVPTRWRANSEVLPSLLQRATLRELLAWLPSLTMRALDESSPWLNDVVERIRSPSLDDEKLSPAEVLDFWKFYELGKGCVQKRNAQVRRQAAPSKKKKRKTENGAASATENSALVVERKTAVRPLANIVDALEMLFSLSFQNHRGAPGKAFHICVDVRAEMFCPFGAARTAKGAPRAASSARTNVDGVRRRYVKHLTPALAAATIVLTAVRVQPLKSVRAFSGNSGVVPLNLNEKMSVDEVVDEMKKTHVGVPAPPVAIFDTPNSVFVCLIERVPLLAVHREWCAAISEKLHGGAKFVLCYLRSSETPLAALLDGIDERLFVSVGFDRFLPDLIWRFARDEL